MSNPFNDHPIRKMNPLALNLFSSFVFLAFIFAIVNKWKNSRPGRKVPPSPWKLPLIGNIHHLMGSLPPHQTLSNLAQNYGPLIHLKLGEISALVVSSARLAEEIMKTHDLDFADRAQFLGTKITLYDNSDIALAPYGEYWRQIRKVCILEALTVKSVRLYDSIRLDEALRLITSVKAASNDGVIPINLRDKLHEFSSSMVCRAALGKISKDDKNTFLKIVKEGLSIFVTLDVVDLFPSIKILHPLFSMKPAFVKIRKKFDDVLDRLIHQHIENLDRTKMGMDESGREGLLDALLRIKESGDLPIQITNDNIKAIIIDIFIGATDNPSATIEWAMSEMIKNPNVMAKAQGEIRKAFNGKKTIQQADVQELKYLKLVIKETLRLHPVVPLLVPRKCRKQCEIDGYTIPVNTMVMVNTWAIGRDPEYWKDPESFKPERFENLSADFTGNNFHYIPFGAGRRICPGLAFGVANIELPLALLLYHFDWKLPSDLNSIKDLDMAESIGMSIMRKNDLQLLATIYEHSPYN